jgi:hypothetical protein
VQTFRRRPPAVWSRSPGSTALAGAETCLRSTAPLGGKSSEDLQLPEVARKPRPPSLRSANKQKPSAKRPAASDRATKGWAVGVARTGVVARGGRPGVPAGEGSSRAGGPRRPGAERVGRPSHTCADTIAMIVHPCTMDGPRARTLSPSTGREPLPRSPAPSSPNRPNRVDTPPHANAPRRARRQGDHRCDARAL